MREARIAKRITLRDMAIKTGISAVRISDFEQRRATPTMTEWEKIAEVLGDKIKFAGTEEASENKREHDAVFDGIKKVYEEIERRGYGKGRGVGKDKMTCPVCGADLFFSVSNCNGHVWAKCKTNSCLAWMQ